MPTYRLVSTRRNRDGSYDVPSIDMPLTASDDQAATLMAKRFPIDAYDGSELAWLTDETGRMVWNKTGTVARAA